MKNNKKTNRTRKQRGYVFESSIVEKLNNSTFWIAKRLGSPSTNLPDVMGINNACKTVIAIEAKSTVGNLVYIPQDQIERCRDWVNLFRIYDNKIVVLAFKFGQVPDKRKLTYFYKVFPHKTIEPCEIKCNSLGFTWRKIEGSWISFGLQDFEL